jgi:MFS transporter, DHA2 family, multidrug resistance protein
VKIGTTGRGPSSARLAGSPFALAVGALKQDPGKLGILTACTIAAAATVFEPAYLSLSTGVVEASLRAQDSPAPMILAIGFLLLALMTLVGGSFADIFGRRRFLLVGLVGLTLSNLLGLAWLGTPKLFVLADLLNAVSGVLVLPAAVAIVSLTYGPALRPFAFAVLFTVQGAAMVLAMMLIPWLGEVWDGRATFVPVLVLCAAAIVLVARRASESRAPKSLRRSNIIVNLVVMIGIFVVVFLVVTRGIRSEGALLALLVGLVLLLLAAVVRWLARRSRHFQGVEVYGGRDLGLAIFAGVMMSFAQGAFFFQITPYFYNVQQVGDLEGALRFVPFVIGLVAGGMLIARLAVRFGARRILALSFGTSGVALLALTLLQVDTPYWVMVLPITLIGVAAGLSGPARTTVVMAAPPEGMINGSAAVTTAAGQTGYALGTIVSSVLVTRYADRVFVDALTAAGVPANVVASITEALQNAWSRLIASGYPELPDQVKSLTGVSYADAFTSGMTKMFFLIAIGMFITALVMLVGMRRGLSATMAPAAAETSGDADSQSRS